jgi:hypothetical protein
MEDRSLEAKKRKSAGSQEWIQPLPALTIYLQAQESVGASSVTILQISF